VRILHVDTAAGWRGGQNQALLTALGMGTRGHQVALACRGGSVLGSRARAAGVDVHEFAFRGDWSPTAAAGLARLARRFQPDVVHAHDPHALAAVLAVGGTPRVASRRVDFAIRGFASRWKYDRCQRVIAVSGAVAAVLRHAGLRPERVRVVYEGVPDRRPSPGGRDLMGALGVPPEALVVGTVAALTDHKDHATLLSAVVSVARRVPSAWFVLVGDGERRDALVALASALGVQGRVVFAGFREDLDALIPAFDVFCLSSKMEGLGTSVLDAMCFGRPVVATAAGGIPEAVDDGVTGRVVPVQDPEALASALIGVLSDREERERLGASGRNRFESRFSATRMVDATLAVYEELRP
jgi:glycosyltransferase involved in cell wall biosynthesis